MHVGQDFRTKADGPEVTLNGYEWMKVDSFEARRENRPLAFYMQKKQWLAQ